MEPSSAKVEESALRCQRRRNWENWFGLIEPSYAGSPISAEVKAAYESTLKDLHKAKLGGIDESMNSAIMQGSGSNLGLIV